MAIINIIYWVLVLRRNQEIKYGTLHYCDGTEYIVQYY